MNLYWTHKNYFCGLKHFVVVNEFEINKNSLLELVSVLDSNINLTILKSELEVSEEWIPGWQEISSNNAISDEYLLIKKHFNKEICKSVFIKENSPFNIS